MTIGCSSPVFYLEGYLDFELGHLLLEVASKLLGSSHLTLKRCILSLLQGYLVPHLPITTDKGGPDHNRMKDTEESPSV